MAPIEKILSGIKVLFPKEEEVDTSRENDAIIQNIISSDDMKYDERIHIVPIEIEDFNETAVKLISKELERRNIVLLDLNMVSKKPRADLGYINRGLQSLKEAHNGDLSAIAGAKERVLLTPEGFKIDTKKEV